MFDLENLSQEELERLAIAARKRAEARRNEGKFENLREEALEAVKNASADKLPAVLAALKGRKKRSPNGSTAKVKTTYRWDDTLGKNRQVNPEGAFVEPPVFLRGPAAKTPIRG